ncbi:zinc metalloproteinase nas-14-like isoform X2 [Panulirus ornatus]
MAPASHDSIAFDELSTYLEADILADKDHVYKMSLRDNHRLWVGGDLLYKLDYDVEANVFVTDIIQTAITKINDVGCVSIVPAKEQSQDYVAIKLGQNYSSYVGRQGGEQDLTVVKEEIDIGSIMHELMHALGFGHEHNRPDRDNYVTVNCSNIKDEAKQYFTKYSANSVYVPDDLDYDYTSIMHATNVYSDKVNVDMSKPVIWRNDGNTELGQRFKLTVLDQKRLKRVYNCHVCKESSHNGLLFRYPGDCSKFYQCSNSISFIMDCPAGLHFSLSKNQCDYPSQANCTFITQS